MRQAGSKRNSVFVASAVIATCASPPAPVAPPRDPARIPAPAVADVSPPADSEPASKSEPLVFVSELHIQLERCWLKPDRGIEWVGYSETLQPDSLAVLDDVAELMRRNPTLTLGIGVHVDSRGSADYNLSLTERRAKVIAEHLSAAGIDAQRFTARGYGESHPIADAPRELQTRVDFWRTDHPDCAINP